jgi:hypothetical protein
MPDRPVRKVTIVASPPTDVMAERDLAATFPVKPRVPSHGR